MRASGDPDRLLPSHRTCVNWPASRQRISPARSPSPTSAAARPRCCAPPPQPRAATRTARSRSRPSPTCARAGSPAPRAAPRAPRRSTGCSSIAGGSRSLRSPASTLEQAVAIARQRLRAAPARRTRAARLEAQHREHVLGRHRDARIDQHRRQASAASSGADSISPMPRISRGRGSRQTGTSAPIRARRLDAAADRRARGGWRAPAAASAAAASDEPPPRPAATGRRLSSVKRPSFRPGTSRGERARGLEHEIVVERAGLPRRSAPRTVERQAPRPARSVSRSADAANTTRLSSS